jgi:hypothetical protein
MPFMWRRIKYLEIQGVMAKKERWAGDFFCNPEEYSPPVWRIFSYVG